MWEKIKAELKALFAELKTDLQKAPVSAAPDAPANESPQPAAAAKAAAPAPENGGKKKDKADEKPAAEEKSCEEEEEDEEELETEGKSKNAAPTVKDLQSKIVELTTLNQTQSATIAKLESEKTSVDEAAGKKTSQALAKQGVPAVQTNLEDKDGKKTVNNADADLLAEYENLAGTDAKAASAFANKHYAAILRASKARDQKSGK